MKNVEKALLVCDMQEAESERIVEVLGGTGISLEILDVKEYQGLDFASPHLYVGQHTFKGVEDIIEFAESLAA